MRIVSRYLARETLLTWAAVTAVLMLILMSNRFALLLGDAAAGRLPRDAVFALLGLASVNYFIVVIPVALFLAVMLALGRLYRDSEMTTLAACGVGPGQIYRPLLLLALCLALLLAWLSLSVAPWAARGTHLIKSSAEHNAQVGSFQSGSFKTDSDGRGVLYAGAVGGGGRLLYDVFMEGAAQGADSDRLDVVTAASGERQIDDVTGAGMLVLKDGYRYEGVPGERDFRIVRFAEHGVRVKPAAPSPGQGYDVYPTRALLGLRDPEAASELEWRVSVPVSALLLVFLAVPLARTSPRQGRYGRLFAAIMVYVIFSNLVGVARVWLQKGVVPAAIGIWWVHAAFLLAACLLLLRQYGWRGLLARPNRAAA